MLALLVLFSLTCVAAGDNMTDELSLQDSNIDKLDAVNVDADKLSARKSVDLSIKMDVNSSYVDGKYNPVGSEVPWTLTVKAKGGTALNTQVRELLSANLGYVNHSTTKGAYDPSTGIWKVGNLKGSASLTIITKLNRAGTYINKFYAMTDSTDSNLANNFGFLSIKTDSPKSTSNITETTGDRQSADHNLHYASMIDDRIKEEGGESGGGHSGGNGSNNGQHNNGYTQSPLTRSQSVLQQVFGLLSNSSSNSKANPSDMYSNEGIAYDYTQIPMLIFSLFLIVLICMVAGDKIMDRS